MKHVMGAVVTLALGLGLAAAAQAHGINRQSAMPSPNMQSGSTEQIQQNQVRPQRQATRQRMTQSKKVALTRAQRLKGKIAVAKLQRQNRMALAQKQRIGKTRVATLNRHNRMALAQKQRIGKTRLALHRQNRSQAVGVGSSTPPKPPNSPGGTQNLTHTH